MCLPKGLLGLVSVSNLSSL